MFNFSGKLFNGMFGKLESGKCKLSMNGDIAVSTPTGYKTYNVKNGRLTNCSNFVFDVGDDIFFVVPTARVDVGDIILVSGTPRCVIEVKNNRIQVINYADSTVETIVPERHVFMGNTYFYGKIVSLIGNGFMKRKGGMNKMLSMLMMKELFSNGSTSSNGNNSMSSLLPLMLMGNGMFSDDMFEGMFDFDSDFDESCDEKEVEEDTDIPTTHTLKNRTKKNAMMSSNNSHIEKDIDEDEGVE